MYPCADLKHNDLSLSAKVLLNQPKWLTVFIGLKLKMKQGNRGDMRRFSSFSLFRKKQKKKKNYDECSLWVWDQI